MQEVITYREIALERLVTDDLLPVRRNVESLKRNTRPRYLSAHYTAVILARNVIISILVGN